MELTVEKYDGKIGVAVSGGIDSMCLLHAYCSVNQDLTVINVEHGIRGENSLRDTDFVRAYCKLNNIPFLTRSVNAVSSAKQGESTETCARRLRYEFFDELLSSGTVKKIALAHHADDNAETVLFNLARGSALAGVCGIRDEIYADGTSVVHPLTGVSRRDIENYIADNGIDYVETRSLEEALPELDILYMTIIRMRLEQCSLSIVWKSNFCREQPVPSSSRKVQLFFSIRQQQR